MKREHLLAEIKSGMLNSTKFSSDAINYLVPVCERENSLLLVIDSFWVEGCLRKYMIIQPDKNVKNFKTYSSFKTHYQKQKTQKAILIQCGFWGLEKLTLNNLFL